jgi:hypothetical protein
MMREAGFYWVKFRGEWEPAKYTPLEDGEPNMYPWEIIKSDCIFEEKEFAEIGPRIMSPEGK